MQGCRIISLDNNNSVQFTSSREGNSTTNDSMVMIIAYAQLHMYTNIMYKFQSSMCKTVGEKKLEDRWTDRQTDERPWQFQFTPLHFVVGGIINSIFQLRLFFRLSLLSILTRLKLFHLVCGTWHKVLYMA